MHPLIIFDDGLGQLGPMTDLRASFEIRTGMLTTAGRIAAGHPKALAAYWVPPHLRDLLQARADAPVNRMPLDEIVDCVNGRWGLPDLDLPLKTGEALVEEDTGHVVMARLRRADAEYLLSTGQLHERVHLDACPDRVLYRFPWDIIALLQRTVPLDG